jgi:ribosome recycling factor
MDTNKLAKDTENKLNGALSHLEDELKKLRTGRAHPSMLDGVMVVAYGTEMPLNQVSNITTPEAQLIQISPFDPTNIQAINDAIRNNQSLGLNPSDDGRVVRIPVPPLTTERRQDIVKQLSTKAEDCHISCRNIRHDALDEAKKAKNAKDITEDDLSSLEKKINDLMANVKNKVEQLTKAKEQEIMTV